MKWGRFELASVSAGGLWLDGGAMFGVIPKPLWERKIQPDTQNRIPLALNSLLIRSPEKTILIDTGCGFKYTEKQLSIYRIEGQDRLLQGLEARGVGRDQIDIVINTHLHFDHCGGNTQQVGDRLEPAFPNATYLVRRRELEDARHPTLRTRSTYAPENWKPLEDSGQLHPVDEDSEVIEGVRLIGTPGHTPGHQSVLVESEGRRLFFIADLCPTAAHVPLAWVMGFDLHPLTTMETRERIYQQAIRENWLIFFEHDAATMCGYLHQEQGRYRLEPQDWKDN